MPIIEVVESGFYMHINVLFMCEYKDLCYVCDKCCVADYRESMNESLYLSVYNYVILGHIVSVCIKQFYIELDVKRSFHNFFFIFFNVLMF